MDELIRTLTQQHQSDSIKLDYLLGLLQNIEYHLGDISKSLYKMANGEESKSE